MNTLTNLPVGNALESITPTAEHKHMLIVEAVRNRFEYGVGLDVPIYRNLPLEWVPVREWFPVGLTSKPSCLERFIQRASSLTPPPLVS